MTAFQAGNAGWVLGDETAEIEDQTPDPEAVRQFLRDHADAYRELDRLARELAEEVDLDGFNLCVAAAHAVLGAAFAYMRQADEQR